MKHGQFEDYVAPARRKPQIWRLVLGVVIAFGIYTLWAMGTFGALYFLPERVAGSISLEQFTRGSVAAAVLLLLTTFGGLALGTVLAARLMHGRGPMTLIGAPRAAARDFAMAVGAAGALYAVALAVWALLFDAVPGVPAGTWALLLPIALIAILIQTGAEEVFFRGYLTQQLAARFRSPLVWAVLPALGFGALHYDPGASGANAVIIGSGAALFGLAAADLTVRTGTLGAAWGFHFINNCIALLVLATEGALPGLALYRTPYSVDAEGPIRWIMVLDLCIVALAWIAVRTATGVRHK